MRSEPAEMASRVVSGDRRALARALTAVESRAGGFETLLAAVKPHQGRAHRVGVTGAPGVGKSTLIDALVREGRSLGFQVAVLCIDPSSAVTRGALLGDRVRMNSHGGDPGVFVRSMASRGAVGGLSASAGDVLDVLDGAGFDLILVETVGAGQVDVEVAQEAETTLVVFAPGAGDMIQAMKSGLMEVADFWVVNKADDRRAPILRDEILSALQLHAPPADVEERVMMVSARDGTGVAELLGRLSAHRRHLMQSGRMAEVPVRRIRRRVAARVRERVDEALASDQGAELVDRVLAGECSVESAANQLMVVGRVDLGGMP